MKYLGDFHSLLLYLLICREHLSAVRLWSVIILVQVALGDDCKSSSVCLLFPKALVVYIYEIGMMVVILLHKGSVEVRLE